jgi:DNA replication and repair protein RecF
VKIRELFLRPFRNIDDTQFAFPADRTLITGRNGRGKTNILEAISYLSIGKSVRGAPDQQAVPHAGGFFDIQAGCDHGARRLRLRLFYGRTEGKRAFAEDEPLERVSQLLGLFRTVHFAPEDVALVLRFPAQRRRLLDILNSQSSPQYLRCLQRYQRVLSQRNALLRNPTAADELAHSSWTEQLADTGGFIRQMRLDTLKALEPRFYACTRRLARRDEEVTVSYRGPSAEESPQAEALLQQLREKAERERELGYTLAGPHRDDLVFRIDGKPADAYASEGQLKSVLIAWKMAEVCFLQSPDAGQPVLLLDDALSELDERRREALMEIVEEYEQVIITSPGPPSTPAAAGFERIELAD